MTDDYGERQRTYDRYIEAISLLNQAIKRCPKYDPSLSYDFPELLGEPERFDDAKFRMGIYRALESRKAATKNPNTWAKAKNCIEGIFRALSPFAKNFLTIASQAQSVYQFYGRSDI